jgi:beta-fructofuranosidase
MKIPIPSSSLIGGLATVLTLAGITVAPAQTSSSPVQNSPASDTPSSSHVLVECGSFIKIYDPSVGETGPWYMNDHCFIRDQLGTWHMFGITHSEPAKPSDEIHFAHATAKSLLQQPWDKLPYALDVATGPPWNETHLWAPYVIFYKNLYYMYYAGGGKDGAKQQIQLATSPDLTTWTRSPKNPMVMDGYHARDPFVLRVKDKWVMYYTATNPPTGGKHVVSYVTSDDLETWGNPSIAFTDPGASGTTGGLTESPFIVQRGDYYYLFIGPRENDQASYNGTDVFVSHDPFHWDMKDIVGHFPAHSAEIVQDTDGKWYISRAGWKQGGLYLAPLIWKDGYQE